MSIMKLLQQAQGGQWLAQLAQQFGLDESTAQQLTQMLAPAIGSAAKQRAQEGEAERVLETFRGESQANLFDDPAAAASGAGQAQGMDFLQTLLGGKQEAEGLAQEAANRAGVESSTVAQFLPALAAMVQGGLQKNMPDSTIDGMEARLSGSGGGGLIGMVGGLLGGKKDAGDDNPLGPLVQMLDQDGDGSVLDDVIGRFLRR
ncbi:DUF937 domain-containing protein [Roseovarius aestuariivivens]|uniref:DUF937 domain-containing protein n=1 Tax=Roseovarius aestuariivivens TaxID=1888910 RepID=UPI001FDA3E45|nr:DUF937 domain-containing protein [Roseovarius aestuariivivens]